MSEGPTRIYVKSGLTHRGQVTQTGGGPERLLIVYLGTSVASLERSPLATIVAPNAKVDMKALANPGYVGGVFAKQVELGPNTTFSRNSFRGSWHP
jgi:hypothetical protein